MTTLTPTDELEVWNAVMGPKKGVDIIVSCKVTRTSTSSSPAPRGEVCLWARQETVRGFPFIHVHTLNPLTNLIYLVPLRGKPACVCCASQSRQELRRGLNIEITRVGRGPNRKAPRALYNPTNYPLYTIRPGTCLYSPTISQLGGPQSLLEKPPIVQLLKNFPVFYATRRFITSFTRALYWSLSWARINPIHTIPYYRSKIHLNIVQSPTSWSS
jgi:hypothetical protein